MTTPVFLAVLLAAFVHAGWNAAIKSSEDKAQAMFGLVLGHAPFALLSLLFVPLPTIESWPYIISGAALHIGYQFFLMHSYQHGDLTHVYPIARGTAPLLTALMAVALVGEELSGMAWSGILVIAAGLMSLVLVRRDDGQWNAQAALLAGVTGCFIAGYSITDGMGARIAGTAIGFYAVLSLINAAVTGSIIGLLRPRLAATTFRHSLRLPILAGGASFLAFSIVIWAFTQAPIALVAALRETSVVFALLIGVFFMKERLNLAKVVATLASTCGVLLIKLSR